MTRIHIGSHLVGLGEPCFMVAEIGINHNGDIDLARRMIDAAALAGADAVKFQNYHTEDFISDQSLIYEYISQGKTVVEPQYDMFKRCELSRDMLFELRRYCDRCNIEFHSTPTNGTGIRDLVDAGTPVLKNGSDYLTHLPLIRMMGETGLPTVLSTGMATLAEIDDAVRTFRETGNNQLILLHCVSAYPTPADEVHLSKMPALEAVFGCPVGFSDHTDGIVAAVGAVLMGACWVEKHFTLDKDLPGPDHRFSANPSEFSSLVNAVRTAEKVSGNPEIAPTISEMAGRRDFRLSCVANEALPEGHCLTKVDIAFRRPGNGFSPKTYEFLVGQKLGRSVPKGHIFAIGDFA